MSDSQSLAAFGNSVNSVGVHKAPLDFASSFPRFHRRNFKRVVGGCAVIEKEYVRPCSTGMSGIYPLILAIQNPESVIYRGHSVCRGLGNSVNDDLSIIERNTSKRPDIRASRRAVDSVPAIDIEFFLGTRRDKRPGFGSFGVRSRRWIDGINLRNARRTAEH